MADSSWRVTSQAADQATITDAGQVITGVRVYFLTAAGNRGSVLVPDDLYNPDTVTGMVAALAAQMDAVSQLTSDQVSTGQLWRACLICLDATGPLSS